MRSKVSGIHLIPTLVIATLLANGWAHAAPAAYSPLVPQAGQSSPGTSTPSPAPPMGARDRLQSAHTLFLEPVQRDSGFPYSDTQTYNAILDALNRWGRFRLVNQAGQADLVLRTHAIANSSVTPSPTPDTSPGTTSYDFRLRVTLADPHTLSPVWDATTPVDAALRHKTREANIATAADNIASNLKQLANVPLTGKEQAGLREASSHHLARNLLFVGAGVGVSLGIFFAVRGHNQNTAAMFCQQHNISPCPGA